MLDIVFLLAMWGVVLAPALLAVNMRLKYERGGRPYGRLLQWPNGGRGDSATSGLKE